MTVSTTNSTQEYVGDGVGSVFIGTFPALDVGDVLTTVDGTQPVSAPIAGDIRTPNAWTVTITPTPVAGAIILLTRATPPIQPTSYTPYGQYQAEQHERDFDRAIMVVQETNSGAIDVSSKADKSTKIVTSDSGTLTITNPTFADDINLTIRKNVANGVAGLDGGGKIPLQALPLAGLSFIGFWSPATDGPTPPALATSGNFYIFSAAGNMTLRESSNTIPHTVAVSVQDYMVYGDADASTGNPAGWYYVPRVLPPVNALNVLISPAIPGITAADVSNALAELNTDIGNISVAASDVTFTPTGSIQSTNVQQAIAELDASISNRFTEVSAEIQIVRGNATKVLGSSSTGGTLNDGAGNVKASWTTADGVISAIAQSNNVAAFTRKDYVDGKIAADIAAAVAPIGMRAYAYLSDTGSVKKQFGCSCVRNGIGNWTVTFTGGSVVVNDLIIQATCVSTAVGTSLTAASIGPVTTSAFVLYTRVAGSNPQFVDVDCFVSVWES
jgi:predicted amino acid-binding ACT domain protein